MTDPTRPRLEDYLAEKDMMWKGAEDMKALIISLWGRAHDQPGYNKKEWQKLQLWVEDLLRGRKA